MKWVKKMVVIPCIIVLGIALLVMPGSAQTCGEDILSSQCSYNACTAALNLQVTRTCDGLELKWIDIGADEYFVVYYDLNNQIGWTGFPNSVSGTSYFISNANLQPGTYSFAIIPYYEDPYFYCYSNIVCDVKFPSTCPSIPEFPSLALPASMIIGFLGAVLLIQRTRQH